MAQFISEHYHFTHLLWNSPQVSVKADLHYMEVRGEYETYPKREYVGSKVLTKETCNDMTSTYKTFDFPGQHADLESFFWSYRIPWWIRGTILILQDTMVN